MKIRAIKFLSIALLFASAFLTTSCEDTVTPSKPSYWPLLKMLGDPFIVINVGDAYVDPGAEATIGGASVPVDVESAVDENTPGAYSVVYSAVNSDGIAATASRVVIVADPSAIEQNDLIGDYTLSSPSRPAPIPTMTVSEPAPGVYYSTNIYGSNGSNAVIQVPGYFYTLDGTNIIFLDGGSISGLFVSSGSTAVWNGSTLACSFTIAAVGPSLFGRTWTHN